MVRRWLAFLGILAFLLSTVAETMEPPRVRTAANQDRYLEESTLLAQRSIRVFRQGVGASLNSEERQIEAGIEYEVEPTWNTNASASISTLGARRIQVSAGGFGVLQWLAASVTASRWGATSQCALDYASHAIDVISENTRNARLGTPPTRMYEFFAFARNQRVCGSFSPEAYGRDQDGQVFMRAAHGQSIRWVLSHELAHHLHGHLDWVTKRTPRPSLSQRRDNERDADRFALRAVTREEPGGIVLALPAYILFGGTSCSPAEESASSHPSAEWRIGIMVEALLDFVKTDAEFRRAAQASGKLAALETSLLETTKLLKEASR